VAVRIETRPPRAPADDLTEQLRRAQEAILRRAFGVSAGVVLRAGFDEEGAGDWQESLCFGKVDGQWKIYVQSGFLDAPDSTRRSDLFATSLETRLLAAKKIPVLVQALEAVHAERKGEDELAVTTRELSRYVDGLLRAER